MLQTQAESTASSSKKEVSHHLRPMFVSRHSLRILADIAGNRGISQNELIIQAVRQYMPKVEDAIESRILRTVSIPTDLDREINEKKGEWGLSREELIRRAIDDFIGNT